MVELELDHPGIVGLLGAGVEGALPYLASEYLAAESLDIALRHYAPATLQRALPLVTRLAEAIEAAHAAGLLHGNLHPRDIFVTPDEVRANGFGIVPALERAGLRAPVRRPYGAPERVAGEAWGPAADVYSLAAVAYELLTGRRAAGAAGQLEEIDGGRGVDRLALRTALRRSLSDDPGERPQRALELVRLLAVAAGEELPRLGEAVPAGAPALLSSAEESGAEDTPPADSDRIVDIGSRRRPRRRKSDRPAPRGSSLAPDPPNQDDALPDDDSPLEVFTRTGEFRMGEDDQAVTLFDVAERPDDDLGAYGVDELGAGETTRYASDHELAPREEVFDEDSRDTRFAPGPEIGDWSGAGDESGLDDASVEPGRLDLEAGEGPPERHESPAFTFGQEQDEAGREEQAYPEVVAAAVEDAPPSERPRAPMLPIAVTLVVGLLVGFAAGYGLGSREPGRPVVSQADGTFAGVTIEPPGAGPASGIPPPAPAAPLPLEAPPIVVEELVVSEPEPVQASAPPPVARPATDPEAALAVRDAPARAMSAREGRLLIRSIPAGATVTVNGEVRGETPLALRELPYGRYAIEVARAGFGGQREEITLSPAQPSGNLTLTLGAPGASRVPSAVPAPSAARTGGIFIESRPRSARAIIDGRFVGETPLLVADLPAGTRTVRLELEGYRPWVMEVRVAAGERVRLAASLERETER